MASTGQPLISSEISSCLLTYNDHIMKIPEPEKVSIQNYHQLPCAEDYSIVSIYNDLFKILGILFDEENLRNKVLSHIRKHWRYYEKMAQVYLQCKKLSLAQWLVSMRSNKEIPADEICIHASGIYLNIHIAVDFLQGTWSILNIPNISHELTAGLSEVHLAYGGSGSFNLLCEIGVKNQGKKITQS